jgi:GT2 family glycosyltransferase
MNFTLITTSYNDADYIKQYVNQIDCQSLKPIELIIVDGGSKDNTLEVIKGLSTIINSFKIRLISDLGRLNIAQAINIGIKHCGTKFMVIGVIGNIYDDFFFEELIKYQSNGQFDIVYGPIFGVDETPFAKTFNNAFINSNRGWDFGIPSNRGVLINNNVFEKCGFFQEDFIYAGEDTEYYRRIQEYGIKIGYCHEAKLYWKTPTNWREYIKKMKANALADLQFEPGYSIIKNIASRAIILLCIVLATIKYYPEGIAIPLILFLLFLLLSAFKISTYHIPAMLLRAHFFFLPAYFYILNIEIYSKKRIHKND